MQLQVDKIQGARAKTPHGGMLARALCVFVLIACALCLGGCRDEMQQALELEQSGDLEGALAVYEEMLAGSSDHVGALSGAAVCLLALQRFDEALELQERVVALDPDDVLTRVELGFNYLNHQERPDDAVGVMGEAAALEPSAKNLTFLAQAQEAAGDPGSAEGTLRQAIDADPQYGYSYSQLASLLEEQERTDEARAVREEAAALGIGLTDVE